MDDVHAGSDDEEVSFFGESTTSDIGKTGTCHRTSCFESSPILGFSRLSIDRSPDNFIIRSSAEIDIREVSQVSAEDVSHREVQRLVKHFDTDCRAGSVSKRGSFPRRARAFKMSLAGRIL